MNKDFTIFAMELLTSYFDAIYQMVASASQRLHWVYLLTGIAAALISYRLYAGERFSLRSFVRYVFPKGTLTSKSARMDVFLILLAPLWLVALIAPFMVSVLAMAELTTQGMEGVFGANTPYDPGIIGMVVYTFCLLLVFDFAEYIAHYLCHRVWFLWEFHKIHHSAETLNPLTAYRFHPFDLLWTGAVIAVLTGICQGLFYWVWNMQPQVFEVMGLQFGLFVFYLAAYNLRHSHVWLPYPRVLSHVFVSPAQHQIHHSTARKHWDKNMGFIFSFWDWMFGTLYVPEAREEIEFGIGGGDDAHYHSPAKVYVLPFVNIGKRIKKTYHKRREAGKTKEAENADANNAPNRING